MVVATDSIESEVAKIRSAFLGGKHLKIGLDLWTFCCGHFDHIYRFYRFCYFSVYHGLSFRSSITYGSTTQSLCFSSCLNI